MIYGKYYNYLNLCNAEIAKQCYCILKSYNIAESVRDNLAWMGANMVFALSNPNNDTIIDNVDYYFNDIEDDELYNLLTKLLCAMDVI